MKIAELLIGFGAGLATAVILVWATDTALFYDEWINPHEYKVLIGPKDIPECSQEITLSIWDSMNDLQIWRWVVACVEAKGDKI